MPVSLVQFATDRRVFYGWVMVFTLAITETVSWGILYYAFSALLTPMRDELGWSIATITGAYSVGLLVSGLAAPFVGHVIDRSGPRLIMTAGSVLGVLTTIGWAKVDTIWTLYAVWAFAGLAMSATLYDPAFTTVTHWFERDRPRALLIITLFAGFASTVFLPLTATLAERSDWRAALMTLAVILVVVTAIPHALVLRSRPEDYGLSPDGIDRSRDRTTQESRAGVPLGIAVRDKGFWWLAFAFFLETFATIAVAVHLIPYLTERGEGAKFAALIAGLIGAAQVAARVMATVLGGRVSEVHLTAIVFALQSVAIAMLLLWQTTPGMLSAVLLLGAGRGVVTLMRPALVVNLFGRTHFGAINGTLALILTGARALAPVAAGLAYVALGGYTPVLWAMAALSTGAALAVLPLGTIAGSNRSEDADSRARTT